MDSNILSPSMVSSVETHSEALTRRVDLLEKELSSTKYEVQQLTSNNRDLKKSIKGLTEDNDELFDKCYYLDGQLTSMNQYSRMNNFEIQGVPERIK